MRPSGEPALPTLITAFSIPGEEGNERLAMDRVAAAIADLGLPLARLERLKTAVSEAAMNAIEYGSQNRPEIPVDIVVETTADAIVVRITDRALSGAVPDDAEIARHRGQARRRAEAPRLGTLPDQEHGGFDGRDQRWVDPDGDPVDGTRGADRWMSDDLEP